MNQNTLRCSYCNSTFDQAIQLADHYVSAHPDSSEANRIIFARTRKKWDT